MNKLKRGLASFGIAATLAVTGGTVAQVAAAPLGSEAEAVVWTQGPVKWQSDYRWDPYAKKYYCGVWAHNDYNWLEELWGNRDGWEREWWALC